MRQIAPKLAALFHAMPLCVLLVWLTRNEWFPVLFATSLPLIILYTVANGKSHHGARSNADVVRGLTIRWRRRRFAARL